MSIPSENTHNPESTAAQVRADLGSVPSGDQTTDEIAAELADHLAASVAAARVRGLNEQQANAEATRRFGDVAAILRQCWWIKQGENVMFRTAAIVLLSVCVIGLFAVAYSAWRIEASFSDQMGELSGQLADLNQTLSNGTPAAPIVENEDQPQITGKLYLGDRSQPAVGAEAEVWDVKQMKMARQVRTDSDGNYAIEELPDGEYFVLAPLVGSGNPTIRTRDSEIRKSFYIQSAPITIWPDGSAFECDLNVQLQVGRIHFEWDRNVKGVVDGQWPRPLGIGFMVRSREYMYLPVPPGTEIVSTSTHSRQGWCGLINESRAGEATDPRWPQSGCMDWPFAKILRGERAAEYADAAFDHFDWSEKSAFEICNDYEVAISEKDRFVPAGRYSAKSLIGPEFPEPHSFVRGSRAVVSEELRQRLSSMESTGETWGRSDHRRYPQEPFEFEVRPNQITRLRLVIPDGYQEEVANAIQNAAEDPTEFQRVCALQAVKIELIGYEDL